MSVQVLAVIPLRLKSTRVKNKVLENLGEGTDKKPLCVWVCERVLQAFQNESYVQVIAAVDDEKTKAALKKFLPSLTVYVTDPALPSGTDRVFAGAQEFIRQNPEAESTLKGIVNIQGDMPYVGLKGLQNIAQFYAGASEEDLKKAPMLTLCQEWPFESGSPKLSDAAAVKVVLDRESFALYFSRHAIPYSRVLAGKGVPKNIAKFHLGVYAYSKEALARFCSTPPHPMEIAEGLEQLRALWLKIPILVFSTECDSNESYRGIDTPVDLKWAKSFYKYKFSSQKTQNKNAQKKSSSKKGKKK